MKHLLRMLKVLLQGLVLLLPSPCSGQPDSLADCFPLAIGNQWSYRFDHLKWDDLDPGYWGISDTGTVVYTIIGKVDYPDSVLWTFRQGRILHRSEGGTFTVPTDSTIVDSTTCVLVELKSGRHELYQQLRPDDYQLLTFRSGLWNTVIPFQRGMPDTARMYRYCEADSTSTASLSIEYANLCLVIDVAVKRDSGLISLHVWSFATLWFENAYHQLLTQTLNGVPDHPRNDLSSAFSLEQNYPNPFNPTTVVSYQLPVASDVKLVVFDILGREVATLVNERKSPGSYSFTFDGSHLASGVYFYRLVAGSFTETKRLLLIR